MEYVNARQKEEVTVVMRFTVICSPRRGAKVIVVSARVDSHNFKALDHGIDKRRVKKHGEGRDPTHLWVKLRETAFAGVIIAEVDIIE